MASIATTPEIAQSGPIGMPKIKIGRLAAHLSLLILVVLWTFPTVGLLISSVRDKDQLAISGWGTAPAPPTPRNAHPPPPTLSNAARPGTADKAVQAGDHWELKGSLFTSSNGQSIETFGATNAT